MAVAKCRSAQPLLGSVSVVNPQGLAYSVNPSGNLLTGTTLDNLDGRFFGNSILPTDANDVSVPAAANADAVVVYPSVTTKSNVIYGVGFGYTSMPTNGKLVVESPSGTVIFSTPVTSEGAGFIDWEKGLKGGTGKEMLVKLVAGGAGVNSQVSVKNHTFG
jgi:hypothetical protein